MFIVCYSSDSLWSDTWKKLDFCGCLCMCVCVCQIMTRHIIWYRSASGLSIHFLGRSNQCLDGFGWAAPRTTRPSLTKFASTGSSVSSRNGYWGGSPNEWEFSPGTTLPIGPRYPRRGLLLTFIMLVSFTGSITTVTTAIPSWPCFVSWFLPRMVKCLRIALSENLHRTPQVFRMKHLICIIWVCCHFSPRSSHRGVDGVENTPWPLLATGLQVHGCNWRVENSRLLGKVKRVEGANPPADYAEGTGGWDWDSKVSIEVYTLWWTYKKQWKMAIEIVVIFPLIAWWIFPLQTVSSPEGNIFNMVNRYL